MRRWLREIGLGARLAVSGGREGLIRTALTALGVGFGVAVLLLSVSVPGILDGLDARTDGRDDLHYGDTPPRSDTSVLMLPVRNAYHDRSVTGRFLRPEGAHPIVPPGVTALPPDGAIVVSPALRDLFATPEGALLRQRFPQPIAGVIGKQGLSGPNELYFYGTRASLAEDEPDVMRVTHYGSPSRSDPLSPILLLLVVVIFVALLMPVAMFVAAATRFGGEQRDRRLAAVRLVGADTWMTRRVAAGEAVVSAALGVGLGMGVFVAGRLFAERFEFASISVYASDIHPNPALFLAIVVAVPLAALLMTLLALRRVVVEPLGVVRRASVKAKRRVWWRLLPWAGGLALVLPLIGAEAYRFNVWQAASGIVLLLLGMATMLPWIFDRLVARLGSGGPVPWQIAVRRLQLSHDSALRAVNAVAVAAAGTIALQMLFAAAGAENTTASRQNVAEAQAVTMVRPGATTPVHSAEQVEAELRGSPAVTSLHSYRQTFAALPGGDGTGGDPRIFEIAIGDCAALRLLAQLPGCADGDVFAVDPKSFSAGGMADATAAAGRDVLVGAGPDDSIKPTWHVPAQLKLAKERRDPYGTDHDGLLVTTGAAPEALTEPLDARYYTFIGLALSVPDAVEHVRNAAMHIGPATDVSVLSSTHVDPTFAGIRRGMFAGAAVVLALVGLSLLVGTLEQLRERRRTLAALVAFGTRRSTMAWSILWQTAVPVALGLLVASVLGLALGAVLLRIVVVQLRLDWAGVGVVSGIAAGVVLLVTLASLPPLFRLMRPEGLRFE